MSIEFEKSLAVECLSAFFAMWCDAHVLGPRHNGMKVVIMSKQSPIDAVLKLPGKAD